MNMVAKGSMPSKAKAAFYAQMSLNQFQAAYLLANSISPKIQSTIWLQLMFFSIELSTKAYLVGSKQITTEKELKSKVNHKFDKYMKSNPKVHAIFNETNSDLKLEYEKQYQSYIKHEFRYLNPKSVFIGNSIELKKEFLILIGKIIEANIKDLLIPQLGALLDS